MYCTNCGKDNLRDTTFCIGCGTPLGQGEQCTKPVMQYAVGPEKKNVPALILGVLSAVLAIALVLSLIGLFGGVMGVSGVASKSFGTPEDAIDYFVGCMKTGDVNGALGACAISEMAQGFDYEAYVERFQILLPVAMSYLPSKYKPYIEFNKEKTAGLIMRQMACFSVAFNIPEEYAGMVEGEKFQLKGGELPEGFIEALDPSKLGGLEIVDTGKMKMHDSIEYRKGQMKEALIFGADDMQSRGVLYKYNGQYYVGGFTLLRYGGRWLIYEMSDPLAKVSAYGTPVKISGEEEFQNMLQ